MLGLGLSTATAVAAVLWLALIAFAVLGGADFGAGVWDLLARGAPGERQRSALIRAVGPIWEGNEIWLIYLITGTFTAFPLVFSTVMTAFFIPIVLALLGIVMRGAAFIFYTHFRSDPSVSHLWGRTFSIASMITPLLFGAVAGASVSGNVRVAPDDSVHANVITTWTTPFALSCGAFAVALCACLAATYMTVEARNQQLADVLTSFRRRALVSGGIAALLGIASAWLARGSAPYLFAGMTTRALPLAIAAVAAGILTALALLLRFFTAARVLLAGGVMLILGGWAVAQLPYLIVPDVTIARGATQPGVEAAVLIASIAGMILVIPSQWYMLHLFKSRDRVRPAPTADQLMESLRARDERGEALASRAAPSEPERTKRRFARWAARWLGKLAALVTVSLAAQVARRWWARTRVARHPARMPSNMHDSAT